MKTIMRLIHFNFFETHEHEYTYKYEFVDMQSSLSIFCLAVGYAKQWDIFRARGRTISITPRNRTKLSFATVNKGRCQFHFKFVLVLEPAFAVSVIQLNANHSN